jgi:hypothetical protein
LLCLYQESIKNKVMPKSKTKKSSSRKKSSLNLLSSNFNYSKTQLAIVVALVIAIGAYVVYRSLAASALVGAIEGEKMKSGGGTNQSIYDRAANNGATMKMSTTGVISGTMTIGVPATKVGVRVRGDQCNGSPNLVMAIDGKSVINQNVTNTTYTYYTVPTLMGKGSHPVVIYFTNGSSGGSCSRALYVDLVLAGVDDTEAPSKVAIVTPKNNATVAGTNVIFSASANDNIAMGHLDYYLDGQYIGQGQGSRYGYVLTWNSKTVGDGSHSFYVRAYDFVGNATNSSAISLNVKNNGTSSSGGGGNCSGSGAPSGYSRLDFCDDFAGTSLDLSKWEPSWLGGNQVTKPSNGSMTSCSDPNQIKFPGDGTAHLRLTRTSCRANNGTTYPFDGVTMDTAPHYTTADGYIEARMYLPASGNQVANWPGFWTDGTGTWPHTGENDIMEGLGGSAEATYHADYGQAGGNCRAVGHSGPGWHTYAAKVSGGRSTYYYDGIQCPNVVSAVNAQHFLIFQNTSEGYGGPTVVPADVQVDWVRVWK